MSLDRLTERAKSVLQTISRGDEISVGELVAAIRSSSGMGTIILQGLPRLKFKKTAKINLDKLVKEAFFQSIKFQHSYVGTEHLLLAMLSLSDSSEIEKVRSEVQRLNIFPSSTKYVDTSKSTPTLSTFGENLTYHLYKNTTELVGRDEVDTLISILLQRESPNPLIVGEPGVGKSTLIDLLASRINSLDVPPLLVGYQIIQFDLMSFIASIFNKGIGVEASLVSLLQEIKSIGRVIISIKDFQNIFVATNAGVAVPMVYSLLKSGLTSTGIRIIATMDTSLYDRIVSENEHIIENFTVLNVEEPSEQVTLKIIEAQARVLARYHNVSIKKDIITYVKEKAQEEIKDLKFPKKALILLDQSCAKSVIRQHTVPATYKNLVDKTFDLADSIDTNLEKGNYDDAAALRDRLVKLEEKMLKDEEKMFVSKRVNLLKTDVDKALVYLTSLKEVDETSIEDLSTISEKIKKKIVGQDKAVDTIVRSLIRSKLGLRAKKRPMGNFLFLGPTGVGKTELAKVLADTAFGAGALIRLDMSDFSEKHNVARLVGAPPGYVGYGEGGELTQKIELKPASVVLFDEIEKAHPDVLNILLQIMEEGELTDAKGTTYDFSQAVIVLTSNLGTDILHKSEIGFENSALMNDATVETRLKNNLKKILKPELINRFDEVVVFKRLSESYQLQIVSVLLNEVKTTLKKQDVFLLLEKETKQYLLKKGYSNEFGARSLRRIIETELLDKVADVLLHTKIKPLRLKASIVNNLLTIEKY